MRLAPFVALLASVSGAYQLAGSLKTPGNAPLAGVAVSLAVSGASTVTAADGSWQLAGTTGLGRSARTDLRATRHLSVVNGRVRLDWSGRDIAGRHGAATALAAASGASAGRASGASDDTLVFAWRGARIGAIPVRLDSVYSLPMRLDTVTETGLGVHVFRYDYSGNAVLSFVLNNASPSDADSLAMRLFLRSKDTLGTTHFLATGTGLASVPMLFKDAFAVAYDICQAYDASGFSKSCDDPIFGTAWSFAALSLAVRSLPLQRIEGSRDPVSGTSLYALDLPLGFLSIKAGSRVRLDAVLMNRGEYSGILSASRSNAFDTLVRAWLPDRTLPVAGDAGWFDALGSGVLPRPVLTGDSAIRSPDWSLQPHNLLAGGPKPYAGMPTLSKDAADLNWASLPVNPYICVYRKGKLLSGYPPVPGRD